MRKERGVLSFNFVVGRSEAESRGNKCKWIVCGLGNNVTVWHYARSLTVSGGKAARERDRGSRPEATSRRYAGVTTVARASTRIADSEGKGWRTGRWNASGRLRAHRAGFSNANWSRPSGDWRNTRLRCWVGYIMRSHSWVIPCNHLWEQTLCNYYATTIARDVRHVWDGAVTLDALYDSKRRLL